jgi:hypothetical protein
MKTKSKRELVVMLRWLSGRLFILDTKMLHMFVHSSYPSLLLQETGQLMLRLTKP